jgi:3'-5' exonuclease
MNVFVFDIETIPDVDAGRRLYGNPTEMVALSDEDVGRVMMLERMRQSSGQSDMVRLHLQRIVAISVVLRAGDKFKVWSLGAPEAPEAELIQRFFDGLGQFSPTLVSWNGSGFDLPVLHYRALLHGVSAPRYWQTDNDMRWNNYLNRYHERHTDLMDVLALYQARAYAPLDEIATLLGFPGKLGMSGDKVWESWLNGGIEEIRHYCETDVLNTYLIYLRFELMRGNLNATSYAHECELVKHALQQENKPHFHAFLDAWK